MRKLLKFTAAGILLAFLGFFFFYFYPRTPIITGFSARSVCSCTFIAGRDLTSIEQNDNDLDIIGRTRNIIDRKNKTVSATIFGLRKRTAQYREGYGCTLTGLDGTQPVKLKMLPPKHPLSDTVDWPYGRRVVLPPDTGRIARIRRVVHAAFDAAGEKSKRTRAVVVVWKGKIIAEQYAAGFDKDTPLLGWSMTKSIINALYGILVQEGRINIDLPVNLPAWAQDERSKITYKHLLQMNSGLEWTEDYGSISDATKMLFLSDDVTIAQAGKKLEFPPGTHWKYSSGTTNLLSGLMRRRIGNFEEYLDFPHVQLFDRIGMTSAVMETDAMGNYIGSSYCFATPRDWARFGLLYLNDGVWNGERILPEGWVSFTSTPAEGSGGDYGAHFWLNAGGEYPDSPHDMFYCDGFQGQYVYVLPGQDLVIVRMGLLAYPEFDADALVSGIVKAVEE